MVKGELTNVLSVRTQSNDPSHELSTTFVLKTLLFVRNTYGKLFNCNKGKAIPLQAWTGLEGSRSLRLPDFKTIGT
jgi:hypothetical protein